MKLTAEDQERVKKWLKDRCGQMRCFCCGNAQWTLWDVPSILIAFDTHTTRFHYHEGIPQITLACKNCGYLVSFATAVVGLKPDEPPAATPSGA